MAAVEKFGVNAAPDQLKWTLFTHWNTEKMALKVFLNGKDVYALFPTGSDHLV